MSVKERWHQLGEKVEQAAIRSGRKGSAITIVAVSKQASLAQMEESYLAGARCFGESKLQVALVKQEAFASKEDLLWDFIGPIQSNKALSIGKSFSCIHSVASMKTAQKLSLYGLSQKRKIACFIEVNSTRESAKFGFFLEELDGFEEELFSLPGLEIRGLMTMGPHVGEEKQIRECFRSVATRASRLPSHARSLSMGMSGDFTLAIEEGATHIRIGSYLYS